MKFSILIVDDDKIVCNSLKRILENKEYIINSVYTAKEALNKINKNIPDLIILDYKLPDKNGLQVLKEIKDKYSNVLVIILTAYGNVSLAVEAMKYGAYDFIEKEADPELVRFTVQKALDTIRLQKEVQALQQERFFDRDLDRIVSDSNVMKDILELADQFAQSNTTILLTGETGTGKSLIAEYIHYKSQRFNQLFLTVNCAAIPRELIESELFGYE
ncbi:MAG: response regulator, partial [Bacteroidales bacterium]|nr:response regulator [Bacteroidales bacterium]